MTIDGSWYINGFFVVDFFLHVRLGAAEVPVQLKWNLK